MKLSAGVGGPNRRRGAVAVMVAVTLVVILSFAALTVDVGAMYNAKADLQRTADAAALAAASALGQSGGQDMIAYARTVARDFAGRNEVLGHHISLDDSDITPGRAVYNAEANTYTFVPTDQLPDAIKIRARMTEDSPNGALSLFFAPIMGHNAAEIEAEAIAMMVPRDIAIVADLSASHTDDSELRHYNLTDINMHEVWNALPGGADELGGGTWNLATIPPGWIQPDSTIPQAAGPGWGYFETLGFGTTTLNAAYDPNADAGLVKLTYNLNWSNAQLSSFLTARGYNAAEVTAIMNKASDTSGYYPERVAVALGLANWNSGYAGGYWQTHGNPAGNGNNVIASSELQWAEPIMGRSLNASATVWKSYANYMKSSSSYMYTANSQFRYQYGVKTFINFLMESRVTNSETPELANTPTQPMQAVKDSVGYLAGYLSSVGSNDQVSLEIYGTTARHEVDLTTDVMAASTRLHAMQGGHYDTFTNMGGGMQRAIEELTSSRARTSATKVMLLLTDGNANVDETGHAGLTEADLEAGAAHARAQAQIAIQQGIRIISVSVGADANQALMAEVATIGEGQHYHASGSISDYSQQLTNIFYTIAGGAQTTLIK